MSSLTASISMVRAFVGMARAIDGARAGISTTSPLVSLDELMDALERCRRQIEDAAVFLEAAAEGAEAFAGRRLRMRFRFLNLMAKAWRSTSEKQRWLRCERDYRRSTGQSTAKSVQSLRRLAEMACRIAEERVARLAEPQVTAEEEAAPAVADEAEGTALTDFRAMRDALLAIGRGEDALEDSEEYKRILKGMEGLFS